ncbi:MAG: acetolactate synthase small subunit [Chitinivibrionales bacterium]|nr:acetolactate synthase small subunit [Chitinivibrionales bacterium]
MNTGKKYSILAENNSGVVSRVAGLFSSRGYAMKSFSMMQTDDSTTIHITVEAEGDCRVLEQIVKQINKLIDVITVVEQETHPT